MTRTQLILASVIALGLFAYMGYSLSLKAHEQKVMEVNRSNVLAFDSVIADAKGSLSSAYQKIRFDDLLNRSIASSTQDTLIQIAIFKERFRLTKFDEKYPYCLALKVETDAKNKAELDKLGSRLEDAGIGDDETERIVLDAIDPLYFFDSENINDCGDDYYTDLKELRFSSESIGQVLEMVNEFESDYFAAQNRSREERRKARDFTQKYLKAFPVEARSSVRKEIEQLDAFTPREFLFRSNVQRFEGIEIPIGYEVFDSESLQGELSTIERQIFASNSLSNGSKPYSYCFGSNNSCSGWGCSKIIVKTPYNSDVLVSIKKGGEVYRHAYIKAGSRYTFNLPDGTYVPYFYYGKGWNPNKFMKNTSCGELRGGFVSNEHFGKDYAQRLNNQILTYELILQANGNFSQKGSNKNEAF